MSFARKATAVAFAASMLLSGTAIADVMVGGQAMFPTKNIIENAVNSADHTTLVAAVKAAGLVDVLQTKGPFTVFAPVNAAFGALPAGTVDTLLKPENKGALTGVLTYHVVPARLTYNDLRNQIKAGHGKATLKTVAGGTLTAEMNGPVNIVIKDATGASSNISVYDVIQSNGVIHSIDRVLMPK
ncbi:MAG: fasciclin domain-containing protein [Alphaproteobacteria bacterium]|nr:fasciclin domain-containing protein [Alphaproteobacteria bacterium]